MRKTPKYKIGDKLYVELRIVNKSQNGCYRVRPFLLPNDGCDSHMSLSEDQIDAIIENTNLVVF